jgi:hypothetical protein
MSAKSEELKTYFIDLPLSRLHVMEIGNGPPLIMVPATISELENWQTLTQFMGQWFRAIFFELPGHGQSTPFPGRFSSQTVAEMVESLVDTLGFKRFNLMGFSFGGILAMRTFQRLTSRIDSLVMIAPCLGYRALTMSPLRRSLLFQINRLLGRPAVQQGFCNLVHNPCNLPAIERFLRRIGRLEDTIQLREKLGKIQQTTLRVLTAQINEILTTEFKVEPEKFRTPCYFAMSSLDPLLHFDITYEILKSHFVNISTLTLSYPFHQAPRPFTLEELNRDFHATVDSFARKG